MKRTFLVQGGFVRTCDFSGYGSPDSRLQQV